MIISVKNMMSTLLLLIAVSLTTWSFYISKNIQTPTFVANTNLPDTIMETVEATMMNKFGTPSLKLSTPQIMHFSENDTSEIKSPKLIVYKQSPEPWYVTANFAKAVQGVMQILLWDNVVIHHSGDKDNPNTTITTSSLTVFPDSQIAKTNEAIIITQPSTTVHAVGMLANMNDGTVKLLSQARGEYVPSS